MNFMESYWEIERKSYKKFDKLEKNLETTVCVVGGGLTRA